MTNDPFDLVEIAALAHTRGGAATSGPTSQQQPELRRLAQTYCPETYARFGNAPTITRRMGERCLDEAGLGMFKGQLDQYFPRK